MSNNREVPYKPVVPPRRSMLVIDEATGAHDGDWNLWSHIPGLIQLTPSQQKIMKEFGDEMVVGLVGKGIPTSLPGDLFSTVDNSVYQEYVRRRQERLSVKMEMAYAASFKRYLSLSGYKVEGSLAEGTPEAG